MLQNRASFELQLRRAVGIRRRSPRAFAAPNIYEPVPHAVAPLGRGAAVRQFGILIAW
jgi:hypothetical protein